MSDERQDRTTVRFGLFELDFAAAELRKRGRRVKLEAQPFQVLTILVRRSGELVTRDELRKELWLEDTFVEFDHSLNTVVKKIRQALGDSPRSPQFVETVPRQGYRFVAAVERVGQARLKRSRLVAVAAAGTFALVAVVVGAWFLSKNNRVESRPLRTVPLTSYPGFEVQPSFSPDGTQLVFWWEGNLWLKSVAAVAGERPRQLTTDPAEGAEPAWSPDGKWIAHVRQTTPGKAAIFLISPLGGRANKLIDVHVADRWGSPRLGWSPDSRWLVVSDKPSESEPFALFLCSLDTRERRQLTAPAGEIYGDSQAAFPPDGRTLAFNRLTVSAPVGERRLFTMGLSPDLTPLGEPREMPIEHDRISNPVWSENGDEIIYASEDRLWRVAASGGGAPRPLLSGPVAYFLPIAIHHRSHRLVYGSSRGDHNIWRVALSNPAGKAAPFLDSTRNDYTPKFSPDGSRIAFASARSGSAEIWVCDRDGSNAVQLTSFAGGPTDWPNWSPDGETIVFYSMSTGNGDLYMVDAEGGRPRRLTDSPATEQSPSWSADGRSIYFSSNRSGELQVWKMPAEGGEPVQVTESAGGYPAVGPDGEYLYYVRDGGLRGISLNGGEETVVLESLIDSNFAVVGDGVYFIPGEEADRRLKSILFQNFETGETSEVTTVEGLVGYRIDVSPDRRELLYTAIEKLDFDLTLVEDFR